MNSDIDVKELLCQHLQWLESPTEGKRINLCQVSLIGVDFRGATLDGCIFKNCDLSGSNLAYAKISGAIFDNSKLRGSDLHAADAFISSFKNADLSYTDLSNTNFEDADLENADLREALVRNTLFRRTNLVSANLEGVLELDTAVMTVGTDLLRAKLDDSTLRKMIRRLLAAVYSSSNVSNELRDALDAPALRVLASSSTAGYNDIKFLLSPNWQLRN